MRSLVSLTACLLLYACLAAGQSPSKPDLSGTWQLNAEKSEIQGSIKPALWAIQQKDGAIHLTETGSSGRKTELQCQTNGTECNVTGGDSAKVSFWYNGPLLVEMERRGEKATRYRMKLSPEGNVLSVDVTYIVPQTEKPDKLYFEKQP